MEMPYSTHCCPAAAFCVPAPHWLPAALWEWGTLLAGSAWDWAYSFLSWELLWRQGDDVEGEASTSGSVQHNWGVILPSGLGLSTTGLVTGEKQNPYKTQQQETSPHRISCALFFRACALFHLSRMLVLSKEEMTHYSKLLNVLFAIKTPCNCVNTWDFFSPLSPGLVCFLFWVSF